MSNIRLYTIDGFHWLGVEFRGKVLLLNRLGRVGDRVRL